MKPISWQELGFSDEEARELAEVRRSDDHFPLQKELELWAQWVKETDHGFTLTFDELDAAWSARDNVDLSVEGLLRPEQQKRVFVLLDELDRRFRDATIESELGGPKDPKRWWRGRIPVSNAARLYLFEHGVAGLDD